MSVSMHEEVSREIDKLWTMDRNKCVPGIDYEINLQNPAPVGLDSDKPKPLPHKLFTKVDEDELSNRKTFETFVSLLDNYTHNQKIVDHYTPREREEISAFLDAIMRTRVMKEAYRFLEEKGEVTGGTETFKEKLRHIWFDLYDSPGGPKSSCSFEHVFVGEGLEEKLKGFHNWLQIYLQEKPKDGKNDGKVVYEGYIKQYTRLENNDSESRLVCPQLYRLPDNANKGQRKDGCSCLMGSSPEFEIAAYTIALLLGWEDIHPCPFGEYKEALLAVWPKFEDSGTPHVATAFFTGGR